MTIAYFFYLFYFLFTCTLYSYYKKRQLLLNYKCILGEIFGFYPKLLRRCFEFIKFFS